ncbi:MULTISPECIES: hypothetical protein [Streptomyces]|uniref:hypothetical protein n=1 Tax=Streptomyces TaxID=1883 RepID=UPI00034AECD2|nr:MULTISPECIES: hypothetical protein [Streptomyces]
MRHEPNRRHPSLLTLLAQSAVDVLDSVVQLFDQTLSGSETRIRIKLRDALAERARLSEDCLTLFDETARARRRWHPRRGRRHAAKQARNRASHTTLP